MDQGPNGASVLRVNPGTVRVLGSHHDCDLHVPADSIAPLHLRLEHTDDGHLFAEDLSAGRTQLNGQPLRGRAPLSAGDELVVGKISLRVESSGETEPAAGPRDTAISKPGVRS